MREIGFLALDRMGKMQKIATFASQLFPVWLLIGCALAWIEPASALWFHPMINLGLGVIMLGMGLTLRFEDFFLVMKDPRRIALGVFLQFFIMPTAAVLCGNIFQLSSDLSLGLILVGCCPGGTASNVICYLARANVALSVLLTMCSTIAAIFLTPLLTKFLAGHILHIDAWQMFFTMIQLVLLPLLLGITINHFVEKAEGREKFRSYLDITGPLVSVLVIVLVVAAIIAKSRSLLVHASGATLPAVVSMHAIGFFFGYLAAKLCREKEEICRTISVEVGMQNSGLGASLANTHFPQLALAPIPAALSAVTHSLLGCFLAWFWRRKIVGSKL
jgi:BASS family bile acid:Na+ symporter